MSRGEDRYAMDVLTVCLTLHESATGAADPLDDDQRKRLTTWLRWRLDSWQEGPPFAAVFDNAVKALCMAALADADREEAAIEKYRGAK